MFINIVVATMLLLFWIPILFLFTEVIAALLPSNTKKKNTVQRLATAILIPAHYEEYGIAETLGIIKKQLSPHDRLIVVADNCHDETAAISLAMGAEVINRHNLEFLGKGYALDYGLQCLQKSPPDVVIIFDADVVIEPGCIDRLSSTAHLLNRPVQAAYLLKTCSDDNATSRISAFAFLFKNLIRPLGLSRLGGGCLLTGTGMAFPWNLIKNAPLASSNIVEDMQLGIDLAINGNTPVFCPDAVLYSKTAPNDSAAQAQRIRWEHGHLLTIFKQIGRTIRSAVKQRRLKLFLLTLEIGVPPLSAFILCWGGAMILVTSCTLGNLLSFNFLTFFLLSGFVLSASILLGWWRFGRTLLPFRDIMNIPFYILWKVPIYISFLIKPQKGWVRTERKSDSTTVQQDNIKKEHHSTNP